MCRSGYAALLGIGNYRRTAGHQINELGRLNSVREIRGDISLSSACGKIGWLWNPGCVSVEAFWGLLSVLKPLLSTLLMWLCCDVMDTIQYDTRVLKRLVGWQKGHLTCKKILLKQSPKVRLRKTYGGRDQTWNGRWKIGKQKPK